ncbi:serine protease [Patescibacteria group bacterium]|nr:serine protease [Patescibacteria group bacterium]
MPSSSASSFVRQMGFWLAMIVIGSVAGGVAGYIAANSVAGGLDSRLSQLWTRVTTSSVTTTTPPAPQIFPLETARRPVYPAVFANRSVSPLLPVVRSAGLKLTEPIVLPADRIQGHAIALTSDGWLMMPASLLTGPLSDLSLVWRSRLYPVTRAVRDRVSGVIFLKIDGSNLPITTFTSPIDVVPGLGVWVETSPRRFRPETIISVDARASLEPVSSERMNRRFLISLNDAEARPGMTVWGADGGLIGIVTKANRAEAEILPTTGLSSALSQVLAARPIQRSYLGLSVQDLSSLVYEGLRPDWPEQGMLVRQVFSTSTGKFLQVGDVIERLDRDAFDGTISFGERLLDYRPGTTVTIRGSRQGKAFQIDVPLQATTTSDLLK